MQRFRFNMRFFPVVFCLLVALAANAGAVFAQQGEPPAAPNSTGSSPGIIGLPPLIIDPPALDFGFIAPGESKTGSFVLKNPTKIPYTIEMLQPTCTCTTTTNLAGRVINPGESIPFDATLAAASATGPRKSTIKLKVEGFNKVVEVDVRGEVVVALRSVPAGINVLQNVPVAGRVVIESVDQKPFKILSVDNKPPVFIGFDPAKDAAKSTYLVRYDFSQFAPPALPAWCLVLTDRTDSPVLALKMRTEKSSVTPVVRMKEYNLNLGVIPQHGSKEFTLDLVDWAIPVDNIWSLSDELLVEMVAQEKQGENMQVRCKVSLKRPMSGLFQFQMAFKTDDKTQKLWAYGVAQDVPAAPAGGSAGAAPAR